MITLQDFKDTEALLTGHFRLSSGLHSAQYLQCARLLMWPRRAEASGRALAEKLKEFEVAAVVSPAPCHAQGTWGPAHLLWSDGPQET